MHKCSKKSVKDDARIVEMNRELEQLCKMQDEQYLSLRQDELDGVKRNMNVEHNNNQNEADECCHNIDDELDQLINKIDDTIKKISW